MSFDPEDPTFANLLNKLVEDLGGSEDPENYSKHPVANAMNGTQLVQYQKYLMRLHETLSVDKIKAMQWDLIRTESLREDLQLEGVEAPYPLIVPNVSKLTLEAGYHLWENEVFNWLTAIRVLCDFPFEALEGCVFRGIPYVDYLQMDELLALALYMEHIEPGTGLNLLGGKLRDKL